MRVYLSWDILSLLVQPFVYMEKQHKFNQIVHRCPGCGIENGNFASMVRCNVGVGDFEIIFSSNQITGICYSSCCFCVGLKWSHVPGWKEQVLTQQVTTVPQFIVSRPAPACKGGIFSIGLISEFPHGSRVLLGISSCAVGSFKRSCHT